MRSVKILIVSLLSLVTFASCNKDDSASLALERTSLYFASWHDALQTISYVSTNAVTVAVASHSTGWNAEVNMAKREIMIWPVGAEGEEDLTDDDLAKEGSVVVNALNKEGQATSYYIYVYIAETASVDSEGRANCYIVTKPAINYTFDAMHRPDGSELDTKSVKLLWQSNSDVVKHASLVGNNAQFYVVASKNDATKVSDTNAVIVACNGADEVIWSWHLWITNENPLATTDTYSNGKTFMRYNLGAFTNSNGDADEQKILDSYGLYYQWGRKDPFPRPLFFDASGAYDEDRYNALGTYIQEVFLECDSNYGTLEYVTKNPMHFITNASCIEEGGDGVGDWLASADNTLWSDTQKGLHDPCPSGWRVPTMEDFAALHIADAEDNTPLATATKQYGWHLSDGTSTYFYPACGRRRYIDGKVENINYYTKEEYNPSLDYDPQPQPWAGYYWTSTTNANGKAVAMLFDLKTTRSINRFEYNHLARKANGLQIRCVKEK